MGLELHKDKNVRREIEFDCGFLSEACHESFWQVKTWCSDQTEVLKMNITSEQEKIFKFGA